MQAYRFVFSPSSVLAQPGHFLPYTRGNQQNNWCCSSYENKTAGGTLTLKKNPLYFQGVHETTGYNGTIINIAK